MSDPFANPADGLGPATYEVTLPDPNGNLVRQKLLLPGRPDASALAGSAYDDYLRRAQNIWSATGEGDLVGADFILDLAGSSFDDDTIIEFAQARRRFLQDRSFLGRIRSIGAEPLDWMINGAEWAIHNTVDRYARFVTDDPKATMAGWAWTSLRLKSDEYESARAQGKGMDEFVQENLQTGTDQALYMVASIATDPTVFVPGAGQISKAGRLIRIGAQRGTKSGRLANILGFRTDPEIVRDVLSMGRGETPITVAQAWKSGRLSAYVKARTGLVPAERKVVEDLLFHGHTTGAMQSILPHSSMNTSGILGWLHEARTKALAEAGGIEALRTPEGFKRAFRSFVDEYAKIFDGRLIEEISPRLDALKDEFEQVRNTLRNLDQVRDGLTSKKGSLLVERELFARYAGSGAPREHVGFIKDVLSSRLNEIDETIRPLENLANNLAMPERLPYRRWTEAMRRYADTEPTVGFHDWEAPFGRITRALLGQPGSARSRGLARATEHLTAMNPHTDIRIESPNWPEQVRRLGQEYEFTLPNWKREDTQRFVSEALDVSDELELSDLLKTRQIEAFQSLGLTEDEAMKLITRHAKQGGETTRNILKGKGTTEALFSTQFLSEVAVMDPRLLRATARRLKEKPGGLKSKVRGRLDSRDVTSILDAANGTWKSLAAARPAYLLRVVGISEMGRMTAAGGTTLIGSPIAWINSAFAGKGGKYLTHDVKKAFDDLGVPHPKAWDDLDAAGLTDGVEFDLVEFMRAVRGVKEPTNLGAQFAPQRISNFMNHADSHGAGLTKRADLGPHQERLYRKKWLQMLQREVAPDPIVQQFLRRGTRKTEVIDWLAGDGRTYAIRKGLNPADPKFRKKAGAFLARQREVFDDLTRGSSEVIANLDNLKMRHLEGLEPPDALPVTIAGRYEGLHGAEMAARVVNESVLGKMWDLAGWFSHVAVRRNAYRNEFVREVVRQSRIARKAGTKVDTRRIIAAAAQNGKGLSTAERSIYNAARNQSEFFVKQTVYDLAETARWTDLARFIAPFSNAWQEELSRWLKITMDRPGTPAFMFSAARAGMENPSFTWEDPTSGRKFLMLPFGDKISRFATGAWNPFTKGEDGLAFPIMIGWDNLSMLNAGGAFGVGLGPWLQVPAEVAAELRPEWRRAVSFLFPFADESIVNTILPSAFFRTWTDTQSDENAAKMVQAVVGAHAHKPADERPPDSVIRSQAKALVWLNAALGLTVGGGARAQLPPKVQELVDFAREMSGEDPGLLDQMLVEEEGEALAAWTTSIWQAHDGDPRGPTTREAVDWLLNPQMRALQEKYPKAFWTFSAEMLPDNQTFDPLELDRQIRNNEVSVANLDQYWDAVQTRIGWAKYGLILDAQEDWLRQHNVTSKNVKAAEPARLAVEAYREALMRENPIWADAYADWSERAHEREGRIREFAQMIQEPEFQGAPVTRYLTEYLGIRARVRSMMTALGYADLDSQQAVNLRVGWYQANTMLLARYPSLRPFYERNLRLDGMDFDIG